MHELRNTQNALQNLNAADQLIHNAKVVGECYRVRVLFDTEANKHDKDYIAIIEETWLNAFKYTAPELLAEAVHEFILSDKNGFLPKPGQIVELLAKSVKDIERRRYFAEIERRDRLLWLAEYENLVEQ